MTTIEDKLSLFSKIIYDKLNEEKEEKLKAYDEEALREINNEKQNIEELRKNLKREALKKANIKANEIVAKEKLNKQREVLALKSNLIKVAVEEIKEMLLNYVKSELYKEYFLTLLKGVFQGIGDGRYCVILLSRDYERFKKEIENLINIYPSKIALIKVSEEDFIGGVILKDLEGKFKIDHSLYSKLTDSEEIIGVKVMEMLS